ncbi:PAS domain S-box-containing protein [Paraburkholderia sp. BL8N3]|nr:PAS domain-containing protein [Paraburkholderia sp. BL8N3]TCK35128.1 PAS domain S-box-containing protein [Paraburkholderia sp. BL8N3]
MNTPDTVRHLIDRVPALVWRVTSDGCGDYFNERWHAFTGLPSGPCDVRKWQAAIHPADVEDLRGLLASPGGGTTEVRIRNTAGGYCWFVVKCGPHVDADDARAMHHVVALELDSERRPGEDGKDVSNGVPAPWENVPTMAWSTRADGYLDYANERWLECCDLTLEQARGWGWRAGVHPDDREGITATWLRLLETGEEGYHEARIGSEAIGWRWCVSKASPARDASGRIVRWYGALFDISDRKLAEDALRRSEVYLEDAQRLSHTGSFGLDPQTGTLYWSEESYRIFEYPRSVTPALALVIARTHPDDLGLVERSLGRAAVQDEEIDVSFRLLMPDCRLKHVRILAHPALGEDGARTLVGAVVDATAARQSEERLHRTHAELAHVTRVATMGELAASIVHEVNQPLAAIVTNGGACLRWLDRPEPDLAEAALSVERMVADARHASDIVRQLRAFASKKTPASMPVDVNAVIRETLPLIGMGQFRKGIVLELQLAEKLPAVLADRVQLQQVLINLISNAAQSVGEQSRDAATVPIGIESALTADGAVSVTVRDSGPGFPPDIARRVFEPFFTTKPDGMGMGLAICRSIIEAHGGRIHACNNDGPGAQIGFVLPAHDPAQSEASAC